MIAFFFGKLSRHLCPPKIKDPRRRIQLRTKRINELKQSQYVNLWKLYAITKWTKWAEFGLERANRYASEFAKSVKLLTFKPAERSKLIKEKLSKGRMMVPQDMLKKYKFLNKKLNIEEGPQFNPFTADFGKLYKFLRGQHHMV